MTEDKARQAFALAGPLSFCPAGVALLDILSADSVTPCHTARGRIPLPWALGSQASVVRSPVPPRRSGPRRPSPS